MIAGTPFARECSFFEIAIEKLTLTRSISIQSSVVSLAGCVSPRAEKHIKRQILKARPNIVVIQFGSTDAAVPIRNRLGRVGGTATKNSDSAITPIDLIKWQIKNIVSNLLFLKPVTPEADYIDAISSMVKKSLSMNVTPIVLSPFGSSHSDRFSKAYSDRLKSVIHGLDGVFFVDAYNELAKQPKSKILCQDGFHVSKFGHELIGNLLATEIEKVILEKIELNQKIGA